MKTGIESNYVDDDKLHHLLNFKYHYLFDKFKAQEHNVKFNAGLNKNTSFFDFSENEKLGIDAGVDYYFDKDSIADVNQGIIRFDPYYSLGFEQYYFKVGLKMDLGIGHHFLFSCLSNRKGRSTGRKRYFDHLCRDIWRDDAQQPSFDER